MRFTPRKFSTRTTLVAWHRWFGVFAALWLILMAISGSVIVFYGELDGWLNPELQTRNSGNLVPLDQQVTAAELALPGSSAYFVDLPDQPGEATRVYLAFPGTDLHPVTAFVDPYTGAVLGDRELGVLRFDRRHIMNVFYDLHIDLLMGEWMIWFLGLVAFLWLIDHLLVLWISFPQAKQWFRSFLIRRGVTGFKLHYDLHRAAGLWLFPFTLMFAVSSLFFNWNLPFEAMVDKFSPTNPRYVFTMEELAEPLYEPGVSFGSAMGIARERAGREVDLINYYPFLGTYMARAYDDRDVDPYGRRLITIDANSGEILDDAHAASGSAGDVFLLWQYPLHSGKAFGWPGRLLIFLSGIGISIMCITGVLVWWRKLRARLTSSSRIATKSFRSP